MNFLMILILAVLALSIGALWAWLKSRPSGPKLTTFKGKLLTIRVPRGNEKDALAAEQMFASLHGLLKLTPEIQEHLTFEIRGSIAGIYFYTWVPEHLIEFVKGQVFAQYPNAEISEATDYASEVTDLGRSISATSMVFTREPFFPIRTFPDFNVDPLAAITGSLSELRQGEEVWLQILIRPIPDNWQERGHQYVEALREGRGWGKLSFSGVVHDILGEIFSIFGEMPKMLLSPDAEPPKPSELRVDLSAAQRAEVEAIEAKLVKMGFEAGIRVVAISPTPAGAEGLLRSSVACFQQFATANLNSFARGEALTDTNRFLEDFRSRHFPDQPYILNTEELASVFHLPNITVETPTIAWSLYKKGEPPLNLPVEGDDITFFGKTTFRDRLVKFGIKKADRTRHLYLIGKTGSGKTTMFENMIIQDIRQGEGVGVLDPHGESVEKILDFIPEERLSDVILFDASDKDYPVGFNMLELPDPEQKSLVASGLIDVFRKRFEFSWGPRLEHILRNCILTLLDVPNTTLLGVTRLLQDRNYRNFITYKIKDPVIRSFWEEEFKGMLANERLVTEAIAPIQNRLGQFLSSPTVRNIVGQAHSSFSLEKIMNEGKIFLVNLSKGKLGVDDSSILGSMIVSRMQFEAMRRVNLPEAERRNFYLYVDEFQNFASGAFASILSEARKYHLCLNLTHQYVAQLPEEMRDAVFGNVGTIASFALGAPDAKVLAGEFTPVFTEEDLISLEKYNVYIELMIDGMTSKPFSAVTLAPSDDRAKLAERVRNFSRQTYGREKVKVAAAINKWGEMQFDLGAAKAEEARQATNSRVGV